MSEILDLGDDAYRDLYRGDWRTPTHREARERGREVLVRERKVVEAVVRSGSRTLLDAGCLDGYLALDACRMGLEVTLLDLSEEIVAKADDTLARNGFRAARRIVSLIETMNRFRAWDACVATEVVEHVRRPDLVMAALRRAARKVVVLTTPVGRYYDDPLHVWHWSDEEALEEALRLRMFSDHSIERIREAGGEVFLVVATV